MGWMSKRDKLTIFASLLAFLLISSGEIYMALFDPNRPYRLGVAHFTVLAYLLAYALAVGLFLSLAMRSSE